MNQHINVFKNSIFTLVICHLLVIILSNYLVQIPVDIFSFTTTWGAFTFPLIFLFTDLTVRLLGATLARKIIFLAMIPALLFSYIISTLFYEGHWVGFSSLSEFNLVVFRIALASFLAYVVGQLMDIYVFNIFRKKKSWWVAPTIAAIFGSAVDAFVFFTTAFYKNSELIPGVSWVEIAIIDYLFKIVISALFFLPLYGLIIQKLLKGFQKLDGSVV